MNGIRRDEVEVVCEGGPGAGTRVSVGVGRHVVGRARTAAVTVADDAVELHHLLLEVAGGHTVRLVQLTGRVPCRVDGSPVGGGGVVITRGATLSVGASRLRVGDPPAPGPAPVPVPAPTLPVPVTRPVVLPRPVTRSVRGPVLATVTAVVLVVAAKGPSAGPALVAAAVLAAVTVMTVRGERVGRRVAADELAASLDALGRELETRRRAWVGERGAGALDLAAAVAMATGASGTCWAREDEGGGQYLVTIGLGPDRWQADVVAGGPVAPAALDLVTAAEQPLDVPVTADLGPGRVLTLSGPGAAGMARALMVQLATAVGPDQLRIGFRDVAGDRPPVWAERLPHLAPVPAGDGHHEIVVVQRPDVVERPPDAIRTWLLVPPSAALVLVDEPARTTVSPVGSRLDLGLVGRSRWRRAPDEVAARDVHPAGLDERSAADVAEALAARVVVGGPPAAVTLAELLAARGGPRPDDTIGVAAAWLTDPVTPDALVGMAGDGVVAIPLGAGAGPVVVIGDDTAAVDRAVTTIVTTWAATVAPHRRAVVRIDMTATPAPWHDLPHVIEARAAAPSSSLVVTDDRDGPVSTLTGRLEDLLVVAGPDPSPTARAVMSHPGVRTIALRLGDEALARRAVGEGRPCRIGVDTAVVRVPGRAARLVRLPGPADSGLAELAGAVRHAAALSAGVGVSPAGA